MAKRFIDTGLFDDSWFMDLSKDGKIVWLYLITKCDHAGIIEINEKLLKMQTGVSSWVKVRGELSDRIVNIRGGYYFIPKFIIFQYPKFPQSNVNQQTGAIKRLTEFGLFANGQLIDYQTLNTSPTLTQDLAKSYGNGNDSVDGNIIEKVITWRDDFEVYLNEAKDEFQKAVDDKKFIQELQYFYPSLDIVKTIYNSWKKFWGNERGWKHKKKSKSDNLDWRLTIRNAVALPSNKIYYTKQELAEIERR